MKPTIEGMDVEWLDCPSCDFATTDWKAYQKHLRKHNKKK